MAHLAIQGHPKRSNEVIEILEMLGGNNKKYRINITECNLLYTIREGDDAIIATYPNSSISKIYTLEEFLEEYPYKVGDKVCFPDDLSTPFTINKMWWDENANELLCSFIEDDIEVPVVGIRTYKEETMKQIKINIPKGYEFFGIDDDNKIVLAKKQYPKTHEECFNICFGNKHHIVQVVGLDDLDDNKELFESFIKLKICRDAYWKIAGEKNKSNIDYVTCNVGGKVINTNIPNSAYNHILTFPTEEMRNTFYENFKELINETKELL